MTYITARRKGCYGCTYPSGHGDGHCATCGCMAVDDPNPIAEDCILDTRCACHGVVCEFCGDKVPTADTIVMKGEWGNTYTACGTCVSKWRGAA